MLQHNFKLVYFLDALFFALMTGAGEVYFSAYALRLGHSELQASLLATVPFVIGGLLQAVAPIGLAKIKSYRTWAVLCAFSQAVLFLPLVFFQSFLKNNYSVLFLVVTMYHIFGLTISPAWVTWLSRLIDKEKTALFFSVGNSITSFFMLAGIVAVGVLLQYGKLQNIDLKIFQIVFFACFLFRAISTFMLFKHPSVEFSDEKKTFRQVLFLKIPNDFLKKITSFTVIFKAGVFISAGFFAPYMLKVLKFSYFEYMIIIASSFFGRIIFLQIFRKYFSNVDRRRVYLLSAVGISIIPALWTLSTSIKYLFILELLTGIFWGAHELSFFLIVFKEAKDDFKTSFMSYFNFYHTIAIGIGVGVGVIIFNFLENQGTPSYVYITIFLTSSLIRLGSFLLFPSKNLNL